MQPEVQIFETVEAMQTAAAHHIAAELKPTTLDRTMTIALSGGSTPRRMHEILADLPGVNWGRVQVFWGDERTVPPDSADSNYGMARQTLFAGVELPAGNVHRMRGELDPQQAAQDYAAELQRVFQVVPPDVPSLDVSILGIGSDGHTASLFPGTDALAVRDRWVVANWVPQQDTWRITLTYPVLNASKLTLFLAAGSDKADALYRMFSPTVDDKPPAAGIQPLEGKVIFFLDQAAAEGIERARARS